MKGLDVSFHSHESKINISRKIWRFGHSRPRPPGTSRLQGGLFAARSGVSPSIPASCVPRSQRLVLTEAAAVRGHQLNPRSGEVVRGFVSYGLPQRYPTISSRIVSPGLTDGGSIPRDMIPKSTLLGAFSPLRPPSHHRPPLIFALKNQLITIKARAETKHLVAGAFHPCQPSLRRKSLPTLRANVQQTHRQTGPRRG
ncbi:hypothetical protein [Jannaschia sp. CCS1]|uniref:hypothetical protein n=1 Tax=Jannaschia sp. (strain CCS1) TaxID=290400 RepID=UPI000053C251|nr:hypothetical protein [Jannaschia sp. CCS1]ABD55549.1 hypothetical protein Jann_2632 [Jannaschia sp. CCS1]